MGMMCSSGGLRLSRCDTSVIWKWISRLLSAKKKLINELSILSHDHIIRFGVGFIFDIPTSLLVQRDELCIIYKSVYRGRSLVCSVVFAKCILTILK